jgi:hypothetical protein
MCKEIWSIIIVAILIVGGMALFSLYSSSSAPPIGDAKYFDDSGDFIWENKYFDSYTCKDCCIVEVNGYYGFVFPNWVYKNNKYEININEVKARR